MVVVVAVVVANAVVAFVFLSRELLHNTVLRKCVHPSTKDLPSPNLSLKTEKQKDARNWPDSTRSKHTGPR